MATWLRIMILEHVAFVMLMLDLLHDLDLLLLPGIININIQIGFTFEMSFLTHYALGLSYIKCQLTIPV